MKTMNLLRTPYMGCIALCMVLLVFSGSVTAQTYQPGPGRGEGGQRGDNVKALKVAFITNRLALTSKEAQGFWPLYNEMQQKIQNINIERRKLRKQTKDGYFSMSDAEMEEVIKHLFVLRQEELDVEKQYFESFKSVIPIKKIALLLKAEVDFRTEVLKQAINRADE